MSAVVARERLSAALAADRAVRAVAAAADTEIAKRDQQLRVMAGAHNATRPSRNRKLAKDHGSANRIVGMDAKQLRDSARQRDRDHDVSRNGLNVLVQNTVGSGIDVMPAPRRAGGEIDRGLAQALRDLWDEWWDRPEVSWRHDWGRCQQLIARSWFRDGEAFFQMLSGPVPYLEHGSAVPLSIEMLEADMVPLDFNVPERRIVQGVEVNAWGRAVAYHVYKSHPGDFTHAVETKRVPAEQVQHIALIDRINQVRGLSVFASVLNRLVDIDEYEDYERIAAKVAASLSAQIIKGQPEMYGSRAGDGDLAGSVVVEAETPYRALTMRPGMIADDLLPGESIQAIDTKRPNPNAAGFVDAQLRRAAGGLGTSFSSLSLNYNGTYSAQRQELVEKWGSYQMLGEQYVALVCRPVWREFVAASVLAGKVRLPRGWSLRELAAASYVRPVMPWIDPLKEAAARGEMEDRGWQAPQQNTLLIGNDPEEVLRLRQDWDRTHAPAPDADANPAAEARREIRAAVVAAALSEND